jgi:hypothetical protein
MLVNRLGPNQERSNLFLAVFRKSSPNLVGVPLSCS